MPLLGGGHDIFLSYARADAASYAEQLEARLRDRFAVFRDDSILEPGGSLPDQLATNAARSAVFLLIGSRAAYDSDWCTQELSVYLDANQKRVRVLRIVFAGHDVPETHRHRDLLEDTLGIDSVGPPSSAPHDDVVRGVQRHFDAVRQRTRRRLAVALAIVTILAAVFFVRSTFATQERDADVDRWSALARRAEDDARFDRAEWAYAAAWWMSDGTRDDVAQSYLRARERRMFEPIDASADRHEVAYAVADHADGFFLVSAIPESPVLRLRTPHASSTLTLDDPDDLFGVTIEDGWLLVETLDRLWVRPIDVEGPWAWLDGAADLVDSAVTDGELHILFRRETQLSVDVYSLPELTASSTSTYELPVDAAVSTCRLLRGGALFAAGDQSGADGGWVPSAWVRAAVADDWTAYPMSRELSVVPQCFHAHVSPRGEIACLALSPVDFSENAAPKPARNLYTRLDDGFGLAWLVHSGFWVPELLENGPIDVVFRTESGDLKWLERPSVVLTQVEPTTLASGVSSHLVWREPETGSPTLIVATEDGQLDVLVDGAVWSRLSVPRGPVNVMTTESRSLLLADTVDGIRLWRRARSGSGSVPDLESLQSELAVDPDEFVLDD